MSKIAEYLNRKTHIRTGVGYLVTFIALILVLTISSFIVKGVKLAYYELLPGDYFLNFTSVTAQDSRVGESVPIEICRERRAQNIKIEAVRTFIVEPDIGVSEYSFPFSVESNGCVNVQVSAERHPQEPGIYKQVVEGEYFVNGSRKTTSYETNWYTYSE